ncbi:TolC family protein [Dokdonella sp. MW10]|uniref:TolC family protein n=1 Tax=Dokdonella sp. MW10 TaxID=2992926 RepID=UPI003F7F8C05
MELSRTAPSRAHLVIVLGLLVVGASPALHALTLAEAEHALALRDPDIIAAAIEVRGSAGDALAATRRTPVELGLSASKISTREGIGSGPLTGKRIDATLGATWTWERGGKRRARMRQADDLARASRLDLEDALRVRGVALHEAYYGLKAAQEHVAVAQAMHDLAGQGLAAADRLVALGQLAKIERERLAVEALRVEEHLRDAELEHLDARHHLARLIGRDEDAESLDADDDWPARDITVPSLPSDASARPDQRAATARVDAADAARDLAHALRRRDIGLGLEVEREPTDIAGVTWGVSVSVPLTGPRHHDGAIARAEADYDAAVLARERARTEARLEMARARAWLDAARHRRRALEDELAPAARRALDGVELAYRRGAAGLTDLLDARRSWRDVESDLIDARAAHATALAAWRAATPADTSPDRMPTP